MKTKQEIEKLIKNTKLYGYSKVRLPYGLSTPGKDRSIVLPYIFPKSLKGKSVLDVGSASGFISFEAESLGASRVIGLELDNERFKNANLYKNIKESNVTFINTDMNNYSYDKEFDYICLLNILHHTSDPFSLLDKIIPKVNNRLIIEYPTVYKFNIDRSTKKKFKQKTLNEIRNYCCRFLKEVFIIKSPWSRYRRVPRKIVIYEKKNATNEENKIFIVTSPTCGGKTTFLNNLERIKELCYYSYDTDHVIAGNSLLKQENINRIYNYFNEYGK